MKCLRIKNIEKYRALSELIKNLLLNGDIFIPKINKCTEKP
jgi:hypothetical protein